ncbi:MAG: SDR family NAD(P)-dependent oxidoreductase [Oscillochloridaceae bacterium]|nr:SDR family NAD(P)-dependent oxidoreductase [Chloroflexaceae bacterium]MDW8390926.1 SDR family NAD(P)-dependent oxidoreductase [Oscillochloridaceae bacterium]
MGELTGKVALVTGGGRGIGRAVALALAGAGAAVAVTGRHPGSLEETVAAIGAAGGRAMALTGDTGDPEAVRAAFAATRAAFGPVGILVVNAGVTASMKLTDTPDALWEEIMRVNASGAFYCCKAAVPDMIAAGWGRIITIASIGGLRGMPYSAAYSASKHALIGLTRSLAGELARHGISVNAVCPGWTDTAMLEEAVANLMAKTGRTAEEARAALLAAGNQSRPVTPEEVAAVVLRLARPDSRENGEAIVVV